MPAILKESLPNLLASILYSVCALPILTGSCAHRANGLGAYGLVSRPLTNPYQPPHARAIGFWSGRHGPYQVLPSITMPPI